MSRNPFQLHPRLEADSRLVSEEGICQLRLINDSRFPWLILVPQIPDVKEMYQIPLAQRQQIHSLTDRIAEQMASTFDADKMNVAAIGNVVPQLHIHVIARRTGDAAWPAPVWGFGEAIPYSSETSEGVITKLRQMLAAN